MNVLCVYILNDMVLKFVHKFNNFQKPWFVRFRSQPIRSDVNFEHIKDECLGLSGCPLDYISLTLKQHITFFLRILADADHRFR